MVQEVTYLTTTPTCSAPQKILSSFTSIETCSELSKTSLNLNPKYSVPLYGDSKCSVDDVALFI